MIVKLPVKGMNCAACSARVEQVSRQVPGVKKADVNLLSETMTVDVQDESCVFQIQKAVEKAGYQVIYEKHKHSGEKNVNQPETKKMLARLIASACFLVALMYFSMGHMLHLPLPSWYVGTEDTLVAMLLQFMLTLPIVVINRRYFIKGFRQLFRLSPNMDSLIAIGSGAALAYGVFVMFRLARAFGEMDLITVYLYKNQVYFESAAMILTLISLGKFLEARAKGKAGDAVRALMDLSPKSAVILVDGQEQSVPIDRVQVGSIVVIRSGDRIQVDGTVVHGHAAVDQSPITGESVPVEKGENDRVSSGTVCTEGYLHIRADKIGEDTTLSQIIRLVEEAGGSKAPIARIADKIAGIFVPTVMSIALITASIWLIMGNGFEFAFSAGISVLVVSCPCALGLATPVAIMVGTGRGASMGVLFKNAQALEQLHQVDTVVLDKTGTLTKGQPSVVQVIPAPSCTRQELLRIASALEACSEHPFAKAIIRYNDGQPFPSAQDYQVLPGRGLCASVDSVSYYGGNASLMEFVGVKVPQYPEYTSQGGTPLYFASRDGQYLGCIIAADVIREDAKDFVAGLKQLHIEPVMLTGDNEQTASAIAEQLQITQVYAQVLPGDKAAVVEQLRTQGRNVLMVGDGINDAPALATANVGMAIGSGTDIAMESSGVVLMNSSLESICNAILLSKACIRNIKQNLFWAFFYNVLGIPVAAGVLYPAFGILLSPMICGAAMSFSSVFVVTNALRLRRFKKKTFSHNSTKDITTQEVKQVETVIFVDGMMCSHCKARVENACKEVAGTVDAVVDLQKKQVTVTGTATKQALIEAIEKAGYSIITE